MRPQDRKHKYFGDVIYEKGLEWWKASLPGASPPVDLHFSADPGEDPSEAIETAELFWGHDILVTGNLVDGPRHASI